MKRILTALPILALVAAAQTVSAAEGAGGHGRPDFSEIDVDGSGALTEEEFLAPMIEHGTERFAVIDTDDDGLITEVELEAAPRPPRRGPRR